MSRTLVILLLPALFFPDNSFAIDPLELFAQKIDQKLVHHHGGEFVAKGLSDNGTKDTLSPESRHIADSSALRPEKTAGRISEIPDKRNITVGLALSGGGAAGLAHIGVLKVFEEAGIPVDLVTGTSMGAIVGALYAIGYSPELMEEEFLNADWRKLFEETIDRIHLPLEEKPYDRVFNLTFPIENGKIQLPTGLVSGNQIFNLLARLTWPYHDIEDFSQLPRPFLCIATDLETGEQVILDRGFLPDAIRASMSIPSIFDPVWIENRYLVDGGVVNNLPVKEAFDLGADFVIAVNSSSDLKPAEELLSLPDILTQTIAVGMRGTMHIQRDLADFYIQPDLARYTTLSFGDVKEIIQAGEKAARDQIDQIRSLADSLNQMRPSSPKDSIPGFQPLEEIPIRSVYFEGLLTVPEDHIRSKLLIYDNSTIDKSTLDEGLSRLFGMGRFDRITYRLIWSDDKADLIINFQEQTANIIQAGIFHNNITGPSLLLNATFRNLLFPASTARINARFGHENRLEGHYFNYIGIEPRLAFAGSAGFRERELYLYDGKRRMASLRTDILFAESLIGTLHASVFRAGVGYRAEYYRLSENIGMLDDPTGWNFLHHITGELEFDNLNRSILPTSGHHLSMRTDFKPKFFPGTTNYWRLSGSWRSYLSVFEMLSLIHQLQGGYLFGDTMPFHYNFFAGGFNSFHGYEKDAISGKNLLAAYIATQYRFYRNFYLTPGLNVGSDYPKMNLDVFDTPLKWGWSVILSWNTFLGPIETVLSGSGDHALLFEFQVGLNLQR